MKAASQITEEPGELNEQLAYEGVDTEPLPDDVFAFAKSSADEVNGEAAETGLKSWYSRLPRVTSAEVESSTTISALPLEFFDEVRESVAAVISRYTLSGLNRVSIALTQCRETDAAPELAAHTAPRVVANFVCEPTRSPFSVDLDARFASVLIDRMLGGDGDPPNTLRGLTTAELAVVEFLFLSITSELNKKTEAPLVRLDSISEQYLAVPSSPRGIAAAFLLDIDQLSSVVHTYLPARALAELGRAHELMRAAGSTRSAHAEAKIKKYSRLIPDVRLSILVGQTDLAWTDLELLESGDVMVVERPEVVWRDGRIRGSLRLRVADGEETLILGDVFGTAEPTIKLLVGSVSTGESAESEERLKMQDDIDGNDVATEENNAIDDVMLTVRVELATRRLRLGELAKLRANQVLDLGCEPTDPVDLVVDGRYVARGELVDIEGRLGVRIKQVSMQGI